MKACGGTTIILIIASSATNHSQHSKDQHCNWPPPLVVHIPAARCLADWWRHHRRGLLLPAVLHRQVHRRGGRPVRLSRVTLLQQQLYSICMYISINKNINLTNWIVYPRDDSFVQLYIKSEKSLTPIMNVYVGTFCRPGQPGTCRFPALQIQYSPQ